jgi:hypothetical protein
MNLAQTGDAGIQMPESNILAHGQYECQIIRDGKVIDHWVQPNLVVNEGLNNMLNVMFNGAAPTAAWFCGLYEGNYTPVATVTAATIPSAATECTAYVSTTRPEYVEATASAQSMTNSANRASFVFTASKTVYGAFLASNSIKNGTSGVLFSAARFASAKTVESGDELLLTYTFTATSV